MAQRLPVLFNKKPCYDIVFTQSFDELWDELDGLEASEKKLCIVTDSNVNQLYGDAVKVKLEGKCRKVCIYEFQAGEENKTLDTVTHVGAFCCLKRDKRCLNIGNCEQKVSKNTGNDLSF